MNLQSMVLVNFKKGTIAGIISYENAELKRNQINHRLLLLIDELEEDEAMIKIFASRWFFLSKVLLP